MAEVAKRITFYGKVQGVGFRAFVFMHAERLKLDGFVRNRKDGTVEALCCGAAQAVEELLETCRKGPPASRVDKVEQQLAQGIVEKGFRQLPTV